MAEYRMRTALFMMTLFMSCFCGFKAWAAVPADLSRELCLQEQRELTYSVLEYKELIHDYRLDLLNLKAEREWVDVKIKRIKEQGRSVPDSLVKAVHRIDGKMVNHEKEMKRLDALSDSHIKAMKNLDAKVKKTFGSPPPDWWRWSERVSPWLYAGKSGSKSKHREAGHDTSHETPAHEVVYDVSRRESSAHAPGRDSNLLESLEEKIKSAGMENWVSLVSNGKELTLEVQLPILFGIGKADVADDYKLFLKKFSSLIKPYDAVIEVAGYPDGNTTDRKSFVSNMAMGTKRAASVVKELMNAGLPASSFKIVSESAGGSKGPVKHDVSAATKRRVEVSVHIKEHEA